MTRRRALGLPMEDHRDRYRRDLSTAIKYTEQSERIARGAANCELAFTKLRVAINAFGSATSEGFATGMNPTGFHTYRKLHSALNRADKAVRACFRARPSPLLDDDLRAVILDRVMERGDEFEREIAAVVARRMRRAS